jgi:hypothetical protein
MDLRFIRRDPQSIELPIGHLEYFKSYLFKQISDKKP